MVRSRRARLGTRDEVPARPSRVAWHRGAAAAALGLPGRARPETEKRQDDAVGRAVRGRAAGLGPGRAEETTRVEIRVAIRPVEGAAHQAAGVGLRLPDS